MSAPNMNRSASLLFSESDLQLAREQQDKEPVRAAVSILDTEPADPIELAHVLALKYLFRHDAAAGESALELILAQDFDSGASPDLPSIKRQFAWLSVVAMLREHPRRQVAPGLRLPEMAGQIAHQLEPRENDDPLRSAWLGATSMAAAILSEDGAGFQRAAESYRRVVAERIHPEGYFKGIVDIEGATATYEAQFSATCALVLMAEMAGQAGLDLWSFSDRAVSVNTAATYTYYYYFFPERWKWETGLSREITMAIMRGEGAFFEMVNRRNPLRGGEQLFAEQRPMFSAWGGGLTTLTHALTPPKKRRWRIF